MIDSLMKFNSVPAEIIIVDNGSKTDESLLLKEKYGDSIIVIRSEKNLGFAGGNNLGIKEAKGKFLLLLNNDTEIKSDSLGFLVSFLESHPDAGIVCPKIKFFDSPDIIQFAGFTPLSPITLRNSIIGFREEDKGQYNTPHTTPYAHGAAMMVRRSALNEVGTMCEDYFLYYEELDWSLRFEDKNWLIWYDPECTIYHKESSTTGKDSHLRRYYLTKNRLIFAKRNLGLVSRWFSFAYQIFISAPLRALSYILKGKRGYLKPILRGLRDGIMQ